MAEDSRAIGVFDSGVGGLTVVRRLAERLPAEAILYLGDTARVPYGTKSPDTVIRYALGCARILLQRGIKLLVAACNTASACALEPLREELDMPVVGVVEPGARAAVGKTKNGRIGVIGTPGTIKTGEYQHAIHAIDPKAQVFLKPCPLFVPLAEEGWTTGPVPRQVAAEYLSGFAALGIDTLVLGCTHYPLLTGVIGEALGDTVSLVDSAAATSEVVEEILSGMGAANPSNSEPRLRFLVSDAPDSFARTGRSFLGQDIHHVEWVDF